MIKTPISVVIPTKNEERNISACLDALTWADEVVVLDSYSTDSTLDILKKHHVQYFQREFDDFATNKNWALDNIPFKYEWILFVDADERIPEDLAQEINRLLNGAPKNEGYYIARKNYFCGKWIKHGGWYPDWNMRLLHRGKARYENRIVHEHVLIEGDAGYLKHPLIHHDFKGIERYIDRHNTYSSLEAVECYKTLFLNKSSEKNSRGLPQKGPGRRRFLKNLAYRYLPARSLFKFFWMYIFKLGILDGGMGLRYCILHSIYEYQVSLKLEELKQTNSPMQTKYGKYL